VGVVIVYVSIGNSDDKLSQAEWADFWALTDELLTKLHLTSMVHGVWHSASVTPWQNACWCVDVKLEHVDAVKGALARLAESFGQDSIAWAEVPNPEFIGADA
jgi:hypothetical protein